MKTYFIGSKFESKLLNPSILPVEKMGVVAGCLLESNWEGIVRNAEKIASIVGFGTIEVYDGSMKVCEIEIAGWEIVRQTPFAFDERTDLEKWKDEFLVKRQRIKRQMMGRRSGDMTSWLVREPQSVIDSRRQVKEKARKRADEKKKESTADAKWVVGSFGTSAPKKRKWSGTKVVLRKKTGESFVWNRRKKGRVK